MPNETRTDTIIAPLPRRSHSTHQPKLPLHHQSKLLQPQYNSKPIKLNQDPDHEVLSEFLSLINPSQHAQSIPILISHSPHTVETPTRNHHTSHKTTSRATTPTHTQISSPCSSPLDSHTKISNQPGHRNQNSNQLGLTTFPNHLSSIVSSPISRCHNPLPRHAGLDVLACRLAEPFKSLHLDSHRPDNRRQEGEEIKPTIPEEKQAAPDSDDVPFLTLDHPHTPPKLDLS